MESALPRSARSLPLSLTIAAAALLAVVTGLTLPVADARAAEPKLAGVNLHLTWGNVDEAEMDRQLDKVQAIGGNLARIDVGWASVEEKGKGQYESWYLKKVDKIVEKAEARGIKLILAFTDSPCWASSAPDSVKQNCSPGWGSRGVQRYTPNNPADYADALAFMVARYGPRVTGWEMWNEVNSSAFYKAADPVRDYVALVKAAYPAAKAAFPDANMIAGSLSESDFAFTEQLYKAGIKGNFDALSIHPYSVDDSPLAPQPDAYIRNSFIRGVPAVRDVMLRYGDDKPMWLTEFGWHTSATRGGEAWKNGVSEATQADYIRKAFKQIAAWDYVKGAASYELKDGGTDPNYLQDNFGLMRNDGSPKPAYGALGDAIDALRSGTPAPGPAPDSAPGGDSAPANGGPAEDRTAPPSAGNSPAAANNRKITLKLRRTGGRKVLTVSGRIRGQRVGTVSVVALHAVAGGRLKPVNTTVAVVRNSNFRATVAKFRKGRWQVQAALRGTGAVDAERFRLGDDAQGDDATELPEGVQGDGYLGLGENIPEQAHGAVPTTEPGVAEETFEDDETPGPLADGGYLAEGSFDDSVETIQETLDVDADGNFGADTEAAVRRFQEANGLVVDGIVGRQTMAALEAR